MRVKASYFGGQIQEFDHPDAFSVAVVIESLNHKCLPGAAGTTRANIGRAAYYALEFLQLYAPSL
jgi:hypothetical protein